MHEKNSVAVLLHQVQESLVALSTAVGELADQVDQDQSARRPDFLTETEMAARLGITKGAIQKRRYSGALPSEVWQKVGSHYVYSLQRYEDWLESIWLGARTPAPEELLKPRSRKKARVNHLPVYQLV
ncbi:hypothetical protein [Pseudomonas paeninsulae]|uniref:hypothetical protein n=1 Tax=Pseudomonas paeninsulae TaxID=3110772 RepID=UPI002D77ACA3|nr:hypothetical protein [Pseudomonas sp. IT1137]